MTLPSIISPPTPEEFRAQQERLGLSNEGMAALYNFGHIARIQKLKAEGPDGSPKTTLSGPGALWFAVIEGEIDVDELIAQLQGKPAYLLEPNEAYLATLDLETAFKATKFIKHANDRDMGPNRAALALFDYLKDVSPNLTHEKIEEIARNAIVDKGDHDDDNPKEKPGGDTAV